MKVCLISTYSNLTVDDDNHKGIEAKYLAQLMQQSGADVVHFIGKKGRTNKNVVGYHDFSEVTLNDYDKVFVQLSPANFFGGKWEDRLEWLIRELPTVATSKIYILPTDPNIRFTNPALQLQNRTGEVSAWAKYVEYWETIAQCANYITVGQDAEKWIGWKPRSVIYVPWFYYVHAKCLTYHCPYANGGQPIDDVCYWGARRGRERELKIRQYFGASPLKIRLVGYDTEWEGLCNNTRVYKRVKQRDLADHISICKTSLIIGDEAHNGNVVTFRFWEAIAGGSIPVIDFDYDPNKVLEDMLGIDLEYVECAEDIVSVCRRWDVGTVMELQRAAARFLDTQASKMRLW